MLFNTGHEKNFLTPAILTAKLNTMKRPIRFGWGKAGSLRVEWICSRAASPLSLKRQDCDRRYAQGAKNLLQPYLYGDPSQNNGAE